MTIRAWQVPVSETETERQSVCVCVCVPRFGVPQTSMWQERKREQNQRAAAAALHYNYGSARCRCCCCLKLPQKTSQDTHTHIHSMAHANLFFRHFLPWSISSCSFVTLTRHWHKKKMLLNKFSIFQRLQLEKPQCTAFSVSSDTDIFGKHRDRSVLANELDSSRIICSMIWLRIMCDI